MVISNGALISRFREAVEKATGDTLTEADRLILDENEINPPPEET